MRTLSESEIEMLKRKKEQAEVIEMEAEAESKRRKADAKKMLQAAQVVSDDMMEWLGQHRLQHCGADLARIAGAYVQQPFHSPVAIYEPRL